MTPHKEIIATTKHYYFSEKILKRDLILLFSVQYKLSHTHITQLELTYYNNIQYYVCV